MQCRAGCLTVQAHFGCIDSDLTLCPVHNLTVNEVPDSCRIALSLSHLFHYRTHRSGRFSTTTKDGVDSSNLQRTRWAKSGIHPAVQRHLQGCSQRGTRRSECCATTKSAHISAEQTCTAVCRWQAIRKAAYVGACLQPRTKVSQVLDETDQHRVTVCNLGNRTAVQS